MSFLDTFTNFKPTTTQPSQANHYGFDYEFIEPRNVLFYDYETVYDTARKISIRTMTWPEYRDAILANMDHTTVAFATNHENVEYLDSAAGFDRWRDAWHSADMYVAHNQIFDARVSRDVFGLPWPKRGLCTLEMAKRCWPAQPQGVSDNGEKMGGHSLGNLTTVIPGLPCKHSIDLENCTDAEKEAYNKQDVEGCRALYYLEMSLLSDNEKCLAELSFMANSLQCHVDKDAAQKAQQGFVGVAVKRVEGVLDAFGLTTQEEREELRRTIFGYDGTRIKSVKYQALKAELEARLNFVTATTSKKKLNMAKLAKNRAAMAVIDNLADLSSTLVYARNVAKLGGVLDVNYRYSFAATGRPSGSGVGKSSFNALNIPKRDKDIAGIIRPLYTTELPCVAADAANAEYRAVGLITSCEHIHRIFKDDPLRDPYSEFGVAALGIRAEKGDPLRDVILKQAVLSLNYLCGLTKWVIQILSAVAKGAESKEGITLEQIHGIKRRQRWTTPSSDYVGRIARDTQAPDDVMAVAYHSYEAFHEIHPELRMFGNWAVRTVEEFASALDGEACLKDRMKYPGAPDPKWCEFLPDYAKKNEKSLTIRCGLWSPTVCWRSIKVRTVKKFDRDEPCISMLHERSGYRAFTKNLAIENLGQSLSRNMISALKLEMAHKHGFDKGFDVYDEAKFYTDEPRRCYESLMSCAGPGSGGMGYGNMFVLHPDECSYSYTMKADEKPRAFWAGLAK